MPSAKETRVLTGDLEIELRRIRRDFTVTGDKLKEISKRFEEELKEGLEKDDQNLV
jgi:hexokinase